MKNTTPNYRFNEFELIPSEGILLKNNEIVKINFRTFKVLELLVKNAGQVVMKDTFMELVWEGSFVEEGNLSVQINALRKVLGDQSKDSLQTFSRRGYRLNCKVEVVFPTEKVVETTPIFEVIEQKETQKSRFSFASFFLSKLSQSMLSLKTIWLA